MPVQYKKSRGFGELDDNYTEGTLVSDTTLTITITVPNGELWLFYGGRAKNGDDVNRNVRVIIYNSSDKPILRLTNTQVVSAASEFTFPNTSADPLMYNGGKPVPLKGGDKIKITFFAGGASSGGTAEVSALVEKFKV